MFTLTQIHRDPNKSSSHKYIGYINNKVKGKYFKMRVILMTEFGAEYIKETRIIVQYEVIHLTAFIYLFTYL
jgi:hypothetical protein